MIRVVYCIETNTDSEVSVVSKDTEDLKLVGLDTRSKWPKRKWCDSRLISRFPALVMGGQWWYSYFNISKKEGEAGWSLLGGVIRLCF